MHSANHPQDNVRQRVLEIVEDDEPKDFNEIYDEIDAYEKGETREALLDLVDSNWVVVNADWEYQRRDPDL